jgi:hypothetical protein
MSKEDLSGHWGQPLPCKVAELIHTRLKPPCRHYIDIDLNKRSKVQFLAFRNFYVASITVQVKTFSEKDGLSADWKSVLTDYQLMADPHYEDDAQMAHVVNLTLDSVCKTIYADPTTSLSKLRVYLLQPSPLWAGKSFHLQHLTCYACGDATMIHNQLAKAGNQPVQATILLDIRERRRQASQEIINTKPSAVPEKSDVLGSETGKFLTCSQALQSTMQKYWERHEESRATFVDKFTYEKSRTDEETILVVGA